MKQAHRRRLLVLFLFGLASCGGTESPTDTVDPAPSVATTVTVSPVTLTLSSLGETKQLAVTVMDQNGVVMSEASVVWASSASSAASVSSTGLVTAVAEGTASITATSGSASATASVTVSVMASCGSETELVLDAAKQGDLRASPCTIVDPITNVVRELPFSGPEPGGTHFYDLYTVDIPAGGIVRFEVTRGTLPNQRLIGYTDSGVYVADEFLNPLVINNASGAVVRYQIVLTTLNPGELGTYSILANQIS